MAGYHAYGTQFLRGDGADPEEFDTIAELGDIDGPGVEQETIDVTSHSSPSRYREHIGGLLDGGEVSFPLNYDPALHDQFLSDIEDTQPRSYRVLFPAAPDGPGGGLEFQAIMTGFTWSFPVEDKMETNFTFKVTGPVTPLEES